MPNKHAAASGTLLFYGDAGAADPATALANIDNFTGLPVHEADEFEITRIDQLDGSEHDPWKQFVADNVDPGDIALNLGVDEDTLETLYTLFRVTKSWKIGFTSGGKFVSDGWIKRIGYEFEQGGEILIPITIRLTGEPTFTKAPAE